MKKVYISGKISNLPADLVELKFKVAEQKLIEKGFAVVNPLTISHDNNPGNKWDIYMRADIKALMDCDCILMLPCWIHSPGAIIEFNLAKSLGFEIIEFDKAFA